MELALTEQLRERQEMEKKLQKLAKTTDYLERVKREESASLIEAAYQQRLVEERMLHVREQQLEIELSQHCHEGDLKEKNRMAWWITRAYSKRVTSCRREEFERRAEREDQIRQMRDQISHKKDRDITRKKMFYVRSEEEKQRKLLEEEEARKQEG